MKTKLFNFILLGTLLFTGVVSAAWEAPSSSFPNGNASAPVHTGDFEQRKSGGFWSKYLHAGTSITTSSLSKIINGTFGFLAGDKTVLAPTGIFKQVFLPGKNSHLRVGTTQEDNIGSALYNAASDSNRAPAVIDLQKRSGSHSVDAVALLKNTNVCTTDLAIVTNTPAIHFWSDKNGASADLIARQIRLSGGNPTSGSVLVSVDSQGNAVWGKPKMVKDGTGWVLAYDYDKSPVKLGQAICEAPVNPEIMGCMDIKYKNNGNYNPKATKDDGSCVCDIGYEFNVEKGGCVKPPEEPEPTEKWWDYTIFGEYKTSGQFRGKVGESCKDWTKRSGRNYPNNFYGVIATGDFIESIFNPFLITPPVPTGPGMCLYTNGSNCEVGPFDRPAPGGHYPVSSCTKKTLPTTCTGPWSVLCISGKVDLKFIVSEKRPFYTAPLRNYWRAITASQKTFVGDPSIPFGTFVKTTRGDAISTRTGVANTQCGVLIDRFGYDVNNVRVTNIKKNEFGVVVNDPFIQATNTKQGSCLYKVRLNQTIPGFGGVVNPMEKFTQCKILPVGTKVPTGEVWTAVELKAGNAAIGTKKIYTPVFSCTDDFPSGPKESYVLEGLVDNASDNILEDLDILFVNDHKL